MEDWFFEGLKLPIQALSGPGKSAPTVIVHPDKVVINARYEDRWQDIVLTREDAVELTRLLSIVFGGHFFVPKEAKL